MARAARLRARARRALFGDIPIYVADGSADHRAHPQLFRSGEVAGVPPDSFSDDRPALGQPALRLDGDARRRLPLVDRAPAPHVRARRPDAHRPLPRLRRLLGGARRATRPRSRAAGAAGPAHEPLPRARGGARRAAGRRRGSRRDHRAGRRGCGASSGCPGWSCSSSRSATTRRTRTCRRTTRSSRSSTPARTTTTRRAAGGSRLTAEQRAWSELDPDDPARSLVGGRVGLARGARDRAAAGRARRSAARRG